MKGRFLIEVIDGLSIEGFLPPGILDVAYSAPLRTFGARGAVTWSDVGASLPAGFAINATTGLITGPADVPGTWAITIRADDASGVYTTRLFTLRVAALPLSATGSIAAMTVGTVASGSVVIAGGRAPYSITASTLPTGVTRSLLVDTITVAGTPTAGHGVAAGASGTFAASITVTDADGATVTYTQAVSYSVPALVVTIASLPDAVVDVPYVGSITSSGGVGARTLSIDAKPAWMSFTAGTGALGGTPNSGDVATGLTVTARVTDAESNTDTDTDTLNVAAPQPATWDASYLTADSLLSDGDTRFEVDGGSGTYRSTRSTLPIVGKRYFNLLLNVDGGGSVSGCGVADAATDLVPNSAWSGEGNSIAWWGPSDGTYNAGALVTSAPWAGMYQPTDWSVDGRDVWVRPSGGAWIGGGDPATGTSPTITLGGSGQLYACATHAVSGASSSRYCILVADPSLVTGTVPAGFTAGIT